MLQGMTFVVPVQVWLLLCASVAVPTEGGLAVDVFEPRAERLCLSPGAKSWRHPGPRRLEALRGRWGHALAPLVLSPADTAGCCFEFDLFPERGQRKRVVVETFCRVCCVGLRLSSPCAVHAKNADLALRLGRAVIVQLAMLGLSMVLGCYLAG